MNGEENRDGSDNNHSNNLVVKAWWLTRLSGNGVKPVSGRY